jgi:TonB family protein
MARSPVVKHSAARALRSPQVNTIAPAPSGAGIDVLTVTEDDFFLLAVRRVVTLPNRVWHATSESQAADMLLTSPCAVALIDLALVQTQLEQVMTRLREQFPELGFVVAGEPEDQTRLTRFLHSGELQGFIAKADVAEKLAAVLEAGINRHLELKTSAAQASVSASRSGRGPMLAGVAAAVVVVGALAGWLLTRGPSETAVPADATASGNAPAGTKLDAAAAVDIELQKARDAFEAGRYTDPKGAGALDHYKLALAADPANAEARDGVHRVAEVMLARAEAAILDQRMRDAGNAIKAAKSIEPGHPRIAVLEAQIAREVDRTQTVQQEQARADAASTKLASLIKLGNERLGQDKLVEPTGDSARYYFTTARELDSASALPQQGLRSLANKMLQKSGAAATRGDLAEAEQWLTQARQLGVSGVDFSKAERDLKNAQRAKSGEAERLAGLARERLASGQLLAPEADSALFYVQALKSQDPSYSGLGPVTDSLRAQLLTGAEEAAGRKDVSVAQKMLDEARTLGASGAGLEAASAAVGKAKRKADALAKPQAVRDDMVVKSVTPEYPSKAQRRQVEGYVDLHFTANESGEVVDVQVAKAEPVEMFEDAAIRALKKWKFKPLMIDGEPASQRLALRMRFAMQSD